MHDSQLVIALREAQTTSFMQSIQVSRIPQCQAINGQIDNSSSILPISDRPYTKPRHVGQIPLWERWICPNEECETTYKRTSRISIRRHKRSCLKRRVINDRSFFDARSNVSIAPVEPIIPPLQINNSISNFHRSSGHQNRGIHTSGVDCGTIGDSSQIGNNVQLSDFELSVLQTPESDQLTSDLTVLGSLFSSAESGFDNPQKQDISQKTMIHDLALQHLIEFQPVSQVQQPPLVNFHSDPFAPQLLSTKSLVPSSLSFSPLPMTAFSRAYRSSETNGMSIMKFESTMSLIKPVARRPITILRSE